MPTDEQHSWIQNVFGGVGDLGGSTDDSVSTSGRDVSGSNPGVAQPVDAPADSTAPAASGSGAAPADASVEPCVGVPLAMPHAPKNIMLCATHKHVIDVGDDNKIVADTLTEYYRDHPSEEFIKTPAPDCVPKRNYVDGPKNHVLCAKHGHVYDEYSGDIIADSVEAYDADRPVGRPYDDADCQPGAPVPGAPDKYKLCQHRGHVLDTEDRTIAANTKTMFYRAYPQYAPKAPPSQPGEDGEARAEGSFDSTTGEVTGKAVVIAKAGGQCFYQVDLNYSAKAGEAELESVRLIAQFNPADGGKRFDAEGDWAKPSEQFTYTDTPSFVLDPGQWTVAFMIQGFVDTLLASCTLTLNVQAAAD